MSEKDIVERLRSDIAGTRICATADILDAIDEIERLRRTSRSDVLEEAARVAENGCLVPPDGGSPTDDERQMCEGIAAAIRSLKDTSNG